MQELIKKERTKRIVCMIIGICIGVMLTGIMISKRAMEVDARISKIQESLSVPYIGRQ